MVAHTSGMGNRNIRSCPVVCVVDVGQSDPPQPHRARTSYAHLP
ncbi:MAG: hypothetical protein BIP78_1290 [Candidatus Bipolaricaulis sibiricus]|uniref:Uncharacterized protein n=1 Tax=Bipolaricaulis sibiricus TaxID=2501609 RepID=A0A410FVF8_BIPS1|nr:MAG: hypothetical protein BIP78_1290 [Candidatus Bipolaricaulis sibiricus]